MAAHCCIRELTWQQLWDFELYLFKTCTYLLLPVFFECFSVFLYLWRIYNISSLKVSSICDCKSLFLRIHSYYHNTVTYTLFIWSTPSKRSICAFLCSLEPKCLVMFSAIRLGLTQFMPNTIKWCDLHRSCVLIANYYSYIHCAIVLYVIANGWNHYTTVNQILGIDEQFPFQSFIFGLY